MKNFLSREYVSVIVVTYQKGDLLSICLNSVAAQTHKNIECITILNNSDIRDLQKWKGLYPDFRFDYYPENELYCKPQNRGINGCSGDFVLCLNDDVRLAPNYIEEVLKAVSRDEKLGSVSGCLLRDEEGRVDSTGLFLSRFRRPLDRGYGKRLKRSHAHSGYIFGVNGAAAFYRRAMLEEIKIDNEYFDESFGFYYEDLDLSWRAHRLGWKAFYCPSAIAYHTRGATARSEGHKKRFAFSVIPEELKIRLIRNRYATIIKNDNKSSFLLNLPFVFVYEACQFIYLLFFDRSVLRKVFKKDGFLVSAFNKRKKVLNLSKG